MANVQSSIAFLCALCLCGENRESANKRLFQFSQLLEFLAAPGAFLEYMLPGALQIFGRPALATRVGAFDFREVSGKLGMPVLKQQFVFNVAAGGFVFFPF